MESFQKTLIQYQLLLHLNVSLSACLSVTLRNYSNWSCGNNVKTFLFFQFNTKPKFTISLKIFYFIFFEAWKTWNRKWKAPFIGSDSYSILIQTNRQFERLWDNYWAYKLSSWEDVHLDRVVQFQIISNYTLPSWVSCAIRCGYVTGSIAPVHIRFMLGLIMNTLYRRMWHEFVRKMFLRRWEVCNHALRAIFFNTYRVE